MELTPDTLLEWDKEEDAKYARVERVLFIVPSSGDLAVIALFDKSALPFWRLRSELDEAFANARVRRLDLDPYAELVRPDDELKKSHCERRDAAWAIIAPIIETGIDAFLPNRRGPLVADIARRTKRSKRMIYWYLRRYWQGGQRISVLLPMFGRCGGRGKDRKTKTVKLGRPDRAARAAKRALVVPGSSRSAKLISGSYLISPKDFELFRKGLNACRGKLATAKVPAIFQYIRENHYHRGYALNEDNNPVPQLPPKNEMPTLQQFRYWYEKQRERDPEKDAVSRLGQHRYDLTHRPLLGDASKMAFGPGSIFQIDSTIADLYLVSSLDRSRIVGRPTLYLLVDVFSHLIVGFHVTLEPSSYLAATLGIEHALSNKVAYGRAHGVTVQEYDWPCHHKPENLLADRGELEGQKSTGLLKSLGVHVLNTAPYRADLKGIVERRFRLVNDVLIHWLHGAVLKDRERGERDCRLDAKLTLHEFRKLMIYFCLDHNRSLLKGYRLDEHMMADGVRPYPNELWAWGIKNRSGHLRVEPDLEIVHANLLPTDEATVTQSGIRFKNIHYTCDYAKAAGWFVGKTHKSWRIKVHHDPRTTNMLYIRPKASMRLEKCVLTEADRRYAGCDWHEVEDILERAKNAEADTETAAYQSKADFHANIKAVADEAEANINAALKKRGKESKRSRIKNIKANQRAERKMERRADTALSIPPEPIPGKIIEICTDIRHQDHDEDYVPAPSRLDRLSKILDRQQQQLPPSSDTNHNA